VIYFLKLHIGERSEKELITGFVNRIAELSPQLVTFNGSGFDLPVLRYRAMVHALPAVGLTCRPYCHRYSDDAIAVTFSHLRVQDAKKTKLTWPAHAKC
jgi:predicted PolB exonuclease-like 3'-5' exonuclease